MAVMTKEERKIRRLEKQLEELKGQVLSLKAVIKENESNLCYERQWRVDFQRLVKDVVQQDNLPTASQMLEEYETNRRYYHWRD